MKKNSLVSGAVVLSIGGVLAKVFSAVYRIGLTRILGGVGIGLYQLIFPLYSLCVVLATAGLPMAISKIIANNKGKEKSIIKKCMIFTSLISLSLTFLLLFLSGSLAKIQGHTELTICYIILAPSLILLSASSVLRGYFQGLGLFAPSSISSIVEQFVKLLFGLLLSFLFLPFGLTVSIIGAIISIVISEVLSLIVLIIFYKKKGVKENLISDINFKQLIKDILPITLTNVVLPIASFIDSIIVVNLLSISFSSNTAVFLYGLESGAVSSFVSIPTIFSFSLASVILPALTGEQDYNTNNNRLSKVIKLVLILTVPCVVAFIFMPGRLIELLYSNKLNALGLNGVDISAKLLAISSIGIVFLAINQIFSSSLQAINKRFVTIRNLTIAVVIKFIIEIIFLPNSLLNIYALAFANTVCYITMFFLNLAEIKIHFKLDINIIFTIKLILCNCLMLIVLKEILKVGQSPIITIISVFFAIIIYFASLIIFDIFSIKENKKIKYLQK